MVFGNKASENDARERTSEDASEYDRADRDRTHLNATNCTIRRPRTGHSPPLLRASVRKSSGAGSNCHSEAHQARCKSCSRAQLHICQPISPCSEIGCSTTDKHFGPRRSRRQRTRSAGWSSLAHGTARERRSSAGIHFLWWWQERRAIREGSHPPRLPRSRILLKSRDSTLALERGRILALRREMTAWCLQARWGH